MPVLHLVVLLAGLFPEEHSLVLDDLDIYNALPLLQPSTVPRTGGMLDLFVPTSDWCDLCNRVLVLHQGDHRGFVFPRMGAFATSHEV